MQSKLKVCKVCIINPDLQTLQTSMKLPGRSFDNLFIYFRFAVHLKIL